MKKMMDVFSVYEEEQVLPKTNVLRYAARVLENAGEPVPFKVPVVCFHFLSITLTLTLYYISQSVSGLRSCEVSLNRSILRCPVDVLYSMNCKVIWGCDKAYHNMQPSNTNFSL